MLQDIPYSVLKQDERAYDIMMLRDQHINTFTDIAKKFDIPVAKVKQIYSKTKIRQIRLYVNHISISLGYANTSQIKRIYDNVYDCYKDWVCTCAYLENKHKRILDEYRKGEPGMSAQYIKSMPPYKPQLSKKTVDRVIEMREVEKASYIVIGKEMHMTQAKAKHTYQSFREER